jgi:hypothetical protein
MNHGSICFILCDLKKFKLKVKRELGTCNSDVAVFVILNNLQHNKTLRPAQCVMLKWSPYRRQARVPRAAVLWARYVHEAM